MATSGDGASSSQDMHVVTENGEQCFMWRSNQLTYIGQDRQELPQVLASKFGPLATKLDLSYNSLTCFDGIGSFTNLSELILDNNNFCDQDLKFRQNLRLKVLSLNKNKLSKLQKLIQAIKFNFPNLEYLSLIGNPLCPVAMRGAPSSNRPMNEPTGRCSSSQQQQQHQKQHDEPSVDELILSDTTNGAARRAASSVTHELEHRKYRHFIINHLPNLRFLDSAPISAHERDEALARCLWTVDDDDSASRQSAHERQAEFKLSILSDAARPSQPATSTPKGVFSKLAYKYTGKNSEGNRFIRNHDL